MGDDTLSNTKTYKVKILFGSNILLLFKRRGSAVGANNTSRHLIVFGNDMLGK